MRVVVNGRTRMVPAGSTLLEAAKAAHVDVPTLCYHPRFKPKAVCRMCLVEVNGGPKPVPACYTKVQDGDEVVTDSEALRSFRKADGQFLLARHPNDCMRCEVSGDCKLQSLVRNEEWEDKWPHFDRGGGKHPHELHDYTSPAILRDMDKCIECGLCVDACGPEGQNINVIGFAERSTDTVPVTVFDKPLNETACISCGQCTWVCPVGALTERPAWHDVSRVLRDGRRTTVVQVAPATRVAISEEFDMPPGTVSTGRLVNALREAGFTFVFDTNFAADLTIMEEGTELVHRLQAAKAAEECTDGSLEAPALPLFTSCCPGWVNYVELSRPDLIPHLSTTKSPQQMHGVLTKRGPFASGGMAKPQEEEEEEEQQQQQGQQQGQGEEEGTGTGGLMVAQAEAQAGARAGAVAEEPFVVSIMPCTAKKDEAHRPGLEGDVDAVLTTRELARLLRAHGVKFGALPEDGTFDNPLGESTGAAAIFGASGGVLEAALRTAAELVGIADAPVDWNALRGTEMGVKVASVPGVGRVAAISGIGAASRLLADPEWVKQFIMVEVMACPGGCLGGGGEPKSDDPDVLAKRARGVYSIDADAAVRHSHHNESVQRLYAEFLGAPLSHTSHKLLHTAYAPRHSERDVLRRFLSAVDARDGAAVAELFAEDGVWCTNAGVVGADAAADADAGAGAEEEEEEAAGGGGGGVTLKGRTNIAAFITDVLPPNGVGPAMQRHLMADAHRGMRVHAPNGDTSEFTLTFADDGRRIASLERRVVEE